MAKEEELAEYVRQCRAEQEARRLKERAQARAYRDRARARRGEIPSSDKPKRITLKDLPKKTRTQKVLSALCGVTDPKARRRETPLVLDMPTRIKIESILTYKCNACGAEEAYLYRVIPECLGGTGDPINLQNLCIRCAGIKGIRRTDYRTPKQLERMRKAFRKRSRSRNSA